MVSAMMNEGGSILKGRIEWCVIWTNRCVCHEVIPRLNVGKDGSLVGGSGSGQVK